MGNKKSVNAAASSWDHSYFSTKTSKRPQGFSLVMCFRSPEKQDKEVKRRTWERRSWIKQAEQLNETDWTQKLLPTVGHKEYKQQGMLREEINYPKTPFPSTFEDCSRNILSWRLHFTSCYFWSNISKYCLTLLNGQLYQLTWQVNTGPLTLEYTQYTQHFEKAIHY